MSAVDTLLATMRRVDSLRADAAAALKLPDAARYAAKSVDVRTYDDRNRKAVEAVRVLRVRLSDQMAAEAEAERDNIIAACAAELEAIRADLPRQAAAAAIEMGRMARNMVAA